jgi:GNAT superfamily N-acetyltransferase
MIIRKGKKEDLNQVFELVLELAAFESSVDEVKTSIRDMEGDCFGPDPVFNFLVAENNEGIIGLSIFYYRYSTWKGRLLYLEDLIVTEKYRRRGVGTRLMEATIKEAKINNCNGVQWQVLEWNEPALAFYEKYHPVLDGEWINCRIDKKQLDAHNSSS